MIRLIFPFLKLLLIVFDKEVENRYQKRCFDALQQVEMKKYFHKIIDECSAFRITKMKENLPLW